MRTENYDNTGRIADTFTGTLAENKAEAMEILKANFIDKLAKNEFTATLGFSVQNRRGNGYNDLQNVAVLIETQTFLFRDATNVFRQVSANDLVTIKNEMNMNGISLYQSKFTKEGQIADATTLEALWNINLTF